MNGRNAFDDVKLTDCEKEIAIKLSDCFNMLKTIASDTEIQHFSRGINECPAVIGLRVAKRVEHGFWK